MLLSYCSKRACHSWLERRFAIIKSPFGWRLDLIIRAWRLECGVYDALTYSPSGPEIRMR
ncbi:hypothetical protein FCV54_21610 [Vibrio sp. F12]|nr:hypothetical protein FCV54_21610 [Vibrio sp. F12]